MKKLKNKIKQKKIFIHSKIMYQIKKLKMDSWKENHSLTGETQDQTHPRSIGKMIRLLVYNVNIGLTLPIANY